MLQLKNIKKQYVSGDFKQTALDGVSLNFRDNEFVAILGPSGSGKTTMLNIIGGLDKYDNGDLIINGVSTKEYTDRNWDTYRNHTIGFVFQSYNLIPHQTVLANVELALTISGMSKSERRQKAKKALEEVGLGDQLHKKPNQMSGGQMQRVAIARALVNDPDVLLADEPTGALDSETSVQVMELIKEISKDRLVIMVTHNPELAEQYANRIVKVQDGKVVDDSNPYSEECVSKHKPAKEHKKMKKSSMSFKTALLLSFNNLKTKKARTLLTSFAGSIGIIGIALILALSNGIQVYIDSIQRDTLTSYPITIEHSVMDMSSAMSIMSSANPTENAEDGIIKSNNSMAAMIQGFSQGVWNNNLVAFTEFLETNKEKLSGYTTGTQYVYDNIMNIYAIGEKEEINQVSPSPVLSMIEGMNVGGVSLDSSLLSSYEGMIDTWQELMDNKEVLKDQYELIGGEWPANHTEAVLIVDRNNQINDFVQQGLGLTNNSDMMNALMAIQGDKEFKTESKEFSFADIYDLKFKLVLETDCYQKQKDNTWLDIRGDEKEFRNLVLNSEDIKIVGIIRPTGDTASSGGIGYLSELTQYIIEKTNNSEIVKQQKAAPDTDVFTGLPFVSKDESTQKTNPVSYKQAKLNVSPMSYAVTPLASTVENKEPTTEKAPSIDFGSLPAVTEDEIYEKIDKTLSEQDAEEAKRIIKIMLKNVYSLSDRQELISYFNEILKGQTIEGVGTVSGTQAVNMLGMMDKQTKLKMLGAMFEGYISEEPLTEKPTEKPSENPTESTTKPEQPSDNKPTEENETNVSETDPESPAETPQPYASSYDEALKMLGVVDLNNPQKINIYPKDFESKEAISNMIAEYNNANISLGEKDKEIKYTDYIGMLLSSVTTIVNVISYILIAFVAVSLIVSSIMIGIITYISVLERTKEIGILRAIGASKMNVSQVFNAETFIVGLCSGLIGIITTILLIIPGNMVIHAVTENDNMNAVLPPVAGLILIGLSMMLTVIAGLIPARKAAKKDPVIALRSE